MQTTQKLTTQKLILAGMLLALMIVMETLGIGIIPLPGAKATILHLPVVIGTLTGGLGVGLILGTSFGVISLVSAITKPGLLSAFFLNPLISVFPRVLIPVVVYIGYTLMSGSERKFPNLRLFVAGALGSIANTVFVISLLLVMYTDDLAATLNIAPTAVAAWSGGVALVNGLPETAISAFLTWVVVKALSRTRYYKGLRGITNDSGT